MKFFAYYLPQFHVIPENDEWWGEGFTEWRNVKKATPQFQGHAQPIHPFDDNYYNLLDKKTVEWQTQIMKKYQITGMIYYHYYSAGKLLLEKPAENLLKWKDIEQPFFFCWANHSWIRSWEGSKTILREQIYGNEKDWESHFNYLLPFFKDKRYEKKDNCPLLMVLMPDFPERDSIYLFFDKMCKQNGFSGIHIIDVCFENSYIDELRRLNVLEHYSIHFLGVKNELKMYDDNNIQKKLLSFKRKTQKILGKSSFIVNNVLDGNQVLKLMCSQLIKGEDLIHYLFFQWDNTPRRGSKGTVITPIGKKYFYKYMRLIKDEEYCFIFAWNEWTEGAILEPTKENGYKYLEWIREWKDQYN